MKVAWMFAYLLEIAVLSGLFLFVYGLDYSYAFSLSWQFCAGAVFFPLICLLPGFWRVRERKLAVGIFAVYCALVFALYCGATSPVKPFRQFQNDITNGMRRREVQKLLAERFPMGGNFRRPVASFGAIIPDGNLGGLSLAAVPNQALQYTLDPTDGAFNAESLVIYLQNDRVVGTDYLPD